jgi:hypothetical protein
LLSRPLQAAHQAEIAGSHRRSPTDDGEGEEDSQEQQEEGEGGERQGREEEEEGEEDENETRHPSAIVSVSMRSPVAVDLSKHVSGHHKNMYPIE